MMAAMVTAGEFAVGQMHDVALQRLQIFDQVALLGIAEAGAVIVAGVSIAARRRIQHIAPFVGVT